ncbi:MAG: NADH-quinone oxidoreductase subunit J [Myxococcota bacterium]
MSFVFHMSSAIAILATLMAMMSLKAIHALIYFIVSLLALSVALFDVGAPFAAALELIIYAGAIMVLFVFVVMLLNTNRDLSRKNLIFPAILFGLILTEFFWLSPKGGENHNMAAISPYEIMALLFKQYGVLVELTSFILLAGVIAAYRIAKK